MHRTQTSEQEVVLQARKRLKYRGPHESRLTFRILKGTSQESCRKNVERLTMYFGQKTFVDSSPEILFQVSTNSSLINTEMVVVKVGSDHPRGNVSCCLMRTLLYGKSISGTTRVTK
jgi:hypothetical protein